MIRVTFYCVSMMTTGDQRVVVDLHPVIRGRNNDPENAPFWDAAPTGEIRLIYDEARTPAYEVDVHYYVDLERAADGLWTLWSVVRSGDRRREVRPSSSSDGDGLRSAYLRMRLGRSGAVYRLGDPGPRYNVYYTLAVAPGFKSALGA